MLTTRCPSGEVLPRYPFPGGSTDHEITYLNGVATHPLGSTLRLHANLG